MRYFKEETSPPVLDKRTKGPSCTFPGGHKMRNSPCRPLAQDYPGSGESSTILRKRSIAQSHPAEIPFRNVLASSSRRVSSAYRTSRPRFLCVTSPAPSSTCRCFTIAWRVTLASSDSVVADCAPRSPSLFTTESRVRSPSAKNTSAITVLGAFDISL